MKNIFAISLCVILIIGSSPFSLMGQEAAAQFVLPDARAGERYGIAVENVLRDRYRLRVESRSTNAVLQWSVVDGEVPPGLTLSSSGAILGTPKDSQDRTYYFRLRATDLSVPDEALTLSFAVNVKAAGLRLVKINGPMLVPVETNPRQGNDVTVRPTGEPSVAENALQPTTHTSLPQDAAATMRWIEPNKANDGNLPDLTQSPLPVAVGIGGATKACLLNIVVMRKHSTGIEMEVIDQQKKTIDLSQEVHRFKVNLAGGANRIIVTAYKKGKDKDKCESETDLDDLKIVEPPLTLNAECKGENCKFVKPPASDPSLINTRMRAILGIEQSGASSAASAQNPFVDFFFNSEPYKKKLLLWGDIRLTTTPQQVAAFASSATNAVGAAKADKINDLATSFDFKIGPEFQLNPDATTRLSLIAGFGAISTLTGPPTSSPIFKIPANTSSQYANFIGQYPEALTPGATHIAFVPQDQDRFFRQYFAGLRVRSYSRGVQFPSLFDVTFGQNSAVTGGKLRHFVLGFEGSHHIPLINNSIYIFGSANLKVGGPKLRNTPFVLDPADATLKLSDPTVVITSRQSNRDVYRLGFGIDLIKLFQDKKKE